LLKIQYSYKPAIHYKRIILITGKTLIGAKQRFNISHHSHFEPERLGSAGA
jgi:hypothetical protein